MLELEDDHKLVLENYNRPIVHMRRQVKENRFGLIFGAGLSKGCQVPTWRELVEALAKDPEVDGESVLQVVPPRAGLPYKTEMLFEHFKQRGYGNADVEQHNTRALDYQIGADWRELIRKHLYLNVAGNLGDSLDTHPYLKQYFPQRQWVSYPVYRIVSRPRDRTPFPIASPYPEACRPCNA